MFGTLNTLESKNDFYLQITGAGHLWEIKFIVKLVLVISLTAKLQVFTIFFSNLN